MAHLVAEVSSSANFRSSNSCQPTTSIDLLEAAARDEKHR